jgi:hypothetical protein
MPYTRSQNTTNPSIAPNTASPRIIIPIASIVPPSRHQVPGLLPITQIPPMSAVS